MWLVQFIGFIRDTFFFFNDTATTEIYTLSLHDALPIYRIGEERRSEAGPSGSSPSPIGWERAGVRDRKSIRLNSSHANISYAVFCLKKKNDENFTFLTNTTRETKDALGPQKARTYSATM